MAQTVPEWATIAPPWRTAKALDWTEFGRSLQHEPPSELLQTTSAMPGLSSSLGLRSNSSPKKRLGNSLPIATEVTIDGKWHLLPEEEDHMRQGPEHSAARAAAPPENPKSAAARRAARQARSSARSQAAVEAKLRAREPTGSDAAWEERKERILSLLGERDASVGDLKRELRRLLGYADSARTSAREEREAWSCELQALASALRRDLGGLRARADAADAKDLGKPLSAEHDVDLSEAPSDVLRAGRPSEGIDGGMGAALRAAPTGNTCPSPMKRV